MTANGRLGSGPEGRPIYLDGQATTRTDPRVVEAMLPFLADEFGNPHSTEHDYGWAAEEAVEAGREQIARLIGAVSRDVVFTSGATEANNLALRGRAAARRDRGDRARERARDGPRP